MSVNSPAKAVSQSTQVQAVLLMEQAEQAAAQEQVVMAAAEQAAVAVPTVAVVHQTTKQPSQRNRSLLFGTIYKAALQNFFQILRMCICS